MSSKYDELVCTAGFREDGSWVRVYPIPFRKLEGNEQYKKYEWVEMDIEKNTSDFRCESYRPVSMEKPIRKVGEIPSDKMAWIDRRVWVLKNVHYNMTELIALAKDPKEYISLAVFKPSEILDFVVERVEREWDSVKSSKQELFSIIFFKLQIILLRWSRSCLLSFRFDSRVRMVKKEPS